MKPNTLQYYLDLNYDVIVRRFVEGNKSHYHASVAELNPEEFYGVGKTAADAIKSLEEVKEELFPYYLEKGIPIPGPTASPDPYPSGKIILRMPRGLHAFLNVNSKREGVSLNTYIISLLAKESTIDSVTDKIISVIEHRNTTFWQTLDGPHEFEVQETDHRYHPTYAEHKGYINDSAA